MENLEIRGYQAVDRSNLCSSSLEQLRKLHSRFVGLTRAPEVGVFLAFCHILLAKIGAATLKAASAESEYLDALRIRDHFSLDKSPFGESLKQTLGGRSPDDAMLLLTHFYEEGMERADRANLGAFYTPRSYCREALQRLKKNARRVTLFDPFCGAGGWLFSHLTSVQPSLFAPDNIPVFGTDIDRTAVILARLNLSLVLPRTAETFISLTRQIRVVDSLYSNSTDTKVLSEFLSLADFVATNPPYGFAVNSKSPFFYTALERVPDKEVFYYAIEKVRRLLDKEKDAIFLVPNTILLNIGAREFRKHVAEKCDVTVWDHSGSEVFESAHVRTALIQLSGSKRKGSETFYCASLKEKPAKLDRAMFIDGKVGRDSKAGAALFERAIEVDSVFEVSQGLIPYDKYRGHTPEQISHRVYHSDRKEGPEYRRELQGRDVGPFSVKWGGKNWIKYGTWLAAPRAPRFFNEPRVLIREITCPRTGRLNCAYTRHEFYNSPSIINVLHREKGRRSEVELKTLAVLLSSSAYAQYHLSNSPKANKGLFPKILVNDVRRLPLPANFKELDLSETYDKLALMVEAGVSADAVMELVNAAVSKVFEKKVRRAA